jgi:hypothetical protein
MNKEFIEYEQALALKELGFDEPCFTFYPKEGKMGFDGKYHSIKEGYKNSTVNAIWIKRYKKDFECVTAPLYQQAFIWFIEKHGIFVSIVPNRHGSLDSFIGWIYVPLNGSTKDINVGDYKIGFKTYEEAEQACLIKLIEIVKNK